MTNPTGADAVNELEKLLEVIGSVPGGPWTDMPPTEALGSIETLDGEPIISHHHHR